MICKCCIHVPHSCYYNRYLTVKNLLSGYVWSSLKVSSAVSNYWSPSSNLATLHPACNPFDADSSSYVETLPKLIFKLSPSYKNMFIYHHSDCMKFNTKKNNSTFFPGSLHVYHHVCWILSWLWFQDSLNISSLCVKMISGAAWQGKDVVYKEYVNVTDLCMKQERPKPSFLTCFIFHFSLWMRAVMWPKQKNWFWSPSGPLSSLLLWWQLN